MNTYQNALNIIQPDYTVPFATSPESFYFFDSEWNELGFWSSVTDSFHGRTYQRPWGSGELEEAKQRATAHHWPVVVDMRRILSGGPLEGKAEAIGQALAREMMLRRDKDTRGQWETLGGSWTPAQLARRVVGIFLNELK